MYVFAKQEEMKQAKYQGKKIASCHAGDSKTVHRYMGPRTYPVFGGRNIRPFKFSRVERVVSHRSHRAGPESCSHPGVDSDFLAGRAESKFEQIPGPGLMSRPPREGPEDLISFQPEIVTRSWVL